VVGVNTSALIESAIVGRPVLTQLAAEFRETQGGTLHFAYLAEGGPLRVAESFDEHAAQLVAALAGEDGGETGTDAFLRSFVRPHGLTEPATPRLVAAIEALAATLPEAPRAPAAAPLLRATMAPAATLAWSAAAARRGVRWALRVGLRTPVGQALARRWLVSLCARGARPRGGVLASLAHEAEGALGDPGRP